MTRIRFLKVSRIHSLTCLYQRIWVPSDQMLVIGNTPLIQLKVLPGPNDAEVWVKWEGANPTGSMKDRMALNMILGAEESGKLKPGGTVMDYTGGSTGSWQKARRCI